MRIGRISGPAAAAAIAGALLMTAVVGTAAAQAKTLAGMDRDVPTGARISRQGVAHVGKLPYQGGRVLHTNRTHVIFWQPTASGLAFDPGYVDLIETFLADIAADSHRTTSTFGLTGQYADSKGPAVYDSTFAGATIATDPLPASGCSEPAATGPGWTVCLTDAQLEAELEHVIATNSLPTTNHDIYFLVTPDGLGSCTDSSSSSCALGGSASGYCGYHAETKPENGILYAVIPYNAVQGHCQSGNPRPNASTADPTISTISHEQIETITDPDGNAWVDSQGDEAADLCLTTFAPALGGSGAAQWDETIHGGHFFLQEVWSDAQNACEPRAKPDPLSFVQTPQTGHSRSFSFAAHASDPEGKIVGYEWYFGDGHSGRGRRVSHTFRRSGSFMVTLRATDSWGNWTFFERRVAPSKPTTPPTSPPAQ